MRPRYIFFGDDFTGSTDALEQLAANGVECVLFLAPPTPALLARFSQVAAFGIAGDSRSRSPEWMAAHLPPIYTALRAFGAPVVHYKVCSTFDSSPTHGSIGCAVELALPIFPSAFIPVVVGAPHLRRFVTEGELFASGPDGLVLRIDRHPMSRHPVTPMRQPDLRLHLAQQTRLPIGHVAQSALQTQADAAQSLDEQLAAGKRIVLFDTVHAEMLGLVGELLWRRATAQSLFSASSSGLTMALVQAWRAEGLVPPAPVAAPAQPTAPLLIISGSCSTMTARQVQWALGHGFAGVAVDPVRLIHPSLAPHYRPQLLAAALSHLQSGQDTVLYTALGAATADTAGEALGVALGDLLRELLEHNAVQRVMLCGGDTSSHAVQRLGLTALTWITSLQPGAPLCHAHADRPNTRLLELVLKGGQVGTEDLFAVARGR